MFSKIWYWVDEGKRFVGYNEYDRPMAMPINQQLLEGSSIVSYNFILPHFQSAYLSA